MQRNLRNIFVLPDEGLKRNSVRGGKLMSEYKPTMTSEEVCRDMRGGGVVNE